MLNRFIKLFKKKVAEVQKKEELPKDPAADKIPENLAKKPNKAPKKKPKKK